METALRRSGDTEEDGNEAARSHSNNYVENSKNEFMLLKVCTLWPSVINFPSLFAYLSITDLYREMKE